jgi:hypothetical protein
MTPETDAAIAARWPEKWAKANDATLRGRSKARQKLRQQYAYTLEFEAFVAANPNAKCGNCEHFGRVPDSQKRCCDLDSDFYGYAITKADGACVRHKLTEAQS